MINWTDHRSDIEPDALEAGYRDFLFQTEGDSSQPDSGLFRVWSHSFVGPFLYPGSFYSYWKDAISSFIRLRLS